MTISSTVAPRVDYSGNGTTTVFAIPFVFYTSDDIVAVLVDSAGAETTWVISTNYSIGGGGVDAATGTLTATLTIYRRIDQTQETDFQPYDVIDADELERALDRLTLQGQDLKDQIDLAVTLSPTSGLSDLSFPDPEASKVIAWNSGATALENVDMSDAVLNINALTAETTIDGSADYVPFYDASEGANNKVLINNIPVDISGRTADASPDAGADYVMTYDASAGVNKKVLLGNLPTAAGTAPNSASYVVLGTDATLTSERVLTAGSGVAFTDAGAGSTLTATLSISTLTEDTTPDVAADYLATYDNSATANKKVLLSNLPVDISGKTEDTSPDATADFVLTYDASAAANKKVKIQNLQGSKVLISTSTASSSASVSFTGLTSTYPTYLIVIDNLRPSTDGARLLLRTSIDNGSTYTSAANSYTSVFNSSGAATTALDDQTAIYCLVDMDNTAGATGSMSIMIHQPTSASIKTNIAAYGSALIDTTTPIMVHDSASGIMAGRRAAAETNDAIQLLFSSGNITTGTFKLYGMR
jgi:hypothetical protein